MSEHGEQVLLFQWAKLQEMYWPELALLFAIPMGGYRPKVRDPRTGRWYCPSGQKLKDEGAKDGVPDVCLPVARKGFHGLYIEMKFKGNQPTDRQRWWLDALSEQGYLATACWSFEEAQAVITEYLGG